MPTPRANFGTLGTMAPSHAQPCPAKGEASDGIGLEVHAPARLLEIWLEPNS